MKEDASCGSDREVTVKRGKPVKLAATKDQVATSSAIENRYGARLAIRKGNRAVVIILAFFDGGGDSAGGSNTRFFRSFGGGLRIGDHVGSCGDWYWCQSAGFT